MFYFIRYFLHRAVASNRISIALLCVLSSVSTTSIAQGDALQERSLISPLVRQSLLMDLDRVGNKLIAVGERGHILISDDEAASWRQAQVPVRVTLTASFFIDEQRGWAVGHDGVVLRTIDGGGSWIKLLDGNQANALMLEHARKLVTAKQAALDVASELNVVSEKASSNLEEELEALSYIADDAEAFAEEGPSRPFLDLWFKDENEGFIVGAFGLFLRTTDGGQSWTPWFDRIDNLEAYHLNAIRKLVVNCLSLLKPALSTDPTTLVSAGSCWTVPTRGLSSA